MHEWVLPSDGVLGLLPSCAAREKEASVWLSFAASSSFADLSGIPPSSWRQLGEEHLGERSTMPSVQASPGSQTIVMYSPQASSLGTELPPFDKAGN